MINKLKNNTGIFLLLFLPAFNQHAWAQDSLIVTAETVFPIQFDQTLIILPNSIKLSPSKNDIIINYDPVSGFVLLQGISEYLQTHPSDTLYLLYQAYPFSFEKEYKRFSLSPIADTKEGTQQILKTTGAEPFADIFNDNNLRKTGSFVRGISVGSNQDLTLNSGFRLQVDGNLSPDVEISAILTDENLPIQPEGNTQTLQELDKVYIEIRHPSYKLIMGDYEIDNRETRFSSYFRKLQGISGQTGNESISTTASYANSKGKFNSNVFNGIDGNQGPYRLRGRQNEQFIIILAGSERIFLDGQPLTRGETNDYVIDYSSGEITFTSSILITSASRIIVDFEYSDRQYARDFQAAGATAKLFNNTNTFAFSYFGEIDNKNSPVDIILSDEDKAILTSAGNDPLKAIASGVDSVGINPETEKPAGFYEKRDTIDVFGISIPYYKYNPTSSKAFFRVTFTDFGEGKGDYARRSFGFYEWVGEGNGRYRPEVFLPVPSALRHYNFAYGFIPSDDFSLKTEFAVSDYKPNLFASSSSGTKPGGALESDLRVKFPEITMSDTKMGQLQTQLLIRQNDQNFRFIDRNEGIEFSRDWGLNQRTEEGSERLIESNLTYRLPIPIQTGLSLGWLDRENDIYTSRKVLSVSESLNHWPSLNYRWVSADTDVKSIRQQSLWDQHTIDSDYQLGFFNPTLSFLYEDRQEYQQSKDSLLAGSFQNQEIQVGFKLLFSSSQFSYKIGSRQENLPITGNIKNANRSVTHDIHVNIKPDDDLQTTTTLKYFNKLYSKTFRQIGNTNSDALIIKELFKWTPLNRSLRIDFDYLASTQRTSKLDRLYIKVQKGFGNYIWVDRNENGLEEFEEFELTRFNDGDYVLRTFPGDELEPIVDLKTTLRLAVEPSRHDGFEFLPEIIKEKVSTETVLSIEEKNRTSTLTDIYFFRFSSFLNDSLTLAGSQQLIQDVYINQKDRDFNIRFRFLGRQSLVTYSLDNEKRRFAEEQVRLNYHFSSTIISRWDLSLTQQYFSSTSQSRPDYQINGIRLVPLFTYRAGIKWDVNSESRIGYKINRSASQTVFSFAEILRYNFAFIEKGRIRSELEWNYTKVDGSSDDFFPYELTDGNPIGNLLAWRINIDYQISRFINAFLSYDGRTSDSFPIIHTFRAEVRAFF